MPIVITQTKAGLQDIDISTIWQTPDKLIKQFWQGNDENWELYLEKNKINIDFSSVQSLKDLHDMSVDLVAQFTNAIARNSGQFNIKLRNALVANKKFLLAFDENDYYKIDIDISSYDEIIKKELKDKFLGMASRSFIDFREMNDNFFTIIYQRRGLYDEGERITTSLAKKDTISLDDNFQAAKDVNYISSGICVSLAYAGDLDFTYTYLDAFKNPREVRRTSAQILAKYNEKEDLKETKEAKQTITKEAKQTIVKETAAARESLPEDSLKIKILEEGTGTSDVVSNTKQLKTIDADKEKITKENIKKYVGIEAEKFNIRMKKAEEEGFNAYREIKAQILAGLPVNEAMNIAAQKYRTAANEHILNVATMYLTTDILEIGLKETQIKELENIVANKDSEIKKANDLVYNRDLTISQLRETLTNKQNEFTRHKEEYETAYAELAKQSETALQEVQNKTREIILQLNKEKESLLDELDRNDLVISKLQENKSLNEVTIQKLENKNVAEAQKNTELEKKITKLELLAEADKNQIKDLEAVIANKDSEIKKANDLVYNRDLTISQLRETLTNKQNEFTRHKEEYETAYAELAKQSETALQEVQNKTTRIIKELNDEKQKLIEEIDKNNLVITKLQENKIINEKTLKQLEAENIKKAEENAELTKQVMKFELLQEADAKTFTKLNTQIKELENTIDVKNNEIKNLEKRTIIAETKKDDLEVNSSKNYELYRNTEQKLIQLEEKYDKMQDMENTYKLTIEQLKKELVQAERDNKLLQGAKQHMLDTKEIKERKSTVADILNGSNDAKQVRKKANE